MESLKSLTARGLFWSFLDSFGVYLIKFGFTIVIARTLSPEDYGLMGMIVIFISLGQMLMQSGFSMALIQKKETTQDDLSTAFWFNIITAGVIYVILFLSAGGIASFFGKPILVSITRVAAIGIILNSLCSVQMSLLTKKMDFKKLAWINLAGALISGTTGLILALMGYAVWALVFQTLTGNAIYLAGLWITSKWKPRLVFSIQSFKSLFDFGYKILLQGLTDVIFTKSYFPLIGKLFPLAQLGFYTNANRFYDLFIRQTSNSVNRVIFPAFAIIQEDKERFNANYIRSFNLLATVMCMGSVLLIIVSRPFIEVTLTEKWLSAVPLMKLFFIEGFFFPLLLMNLNILNSSGRSEASLKIDIVKKGLIALSVILLFRFGIEALIIGQVTTTFIAFSVSLVVIRKYHNVRLNKICITLIRLCIIIGISFLTSVLLIEPLNIADWTELLIKSSLVPIMFYGFGRILHIEAIDDLTEYLGGFILRRRQP